LSISNVKGGVNEVSKLLFSKSNSLNELKLIISKFLFEIIEENTPYVSIPEEEPFINKYNGKISYDYSGKVEKMELHNLKEIVKSLGKNPVSICYSSKLEEMLSEIYIDQWVPSYVPNCGKDWINYKYILEEKFNEWKNENFDLYDEDGNEINEELESNLDDILYDFFENTSIDIYYQKILRKLK
jgi:hypothetical protein